MNTSLENILVLEAANNDCIHLFYDAAQEHWVAYGQSALNLVQLVPELESELTEELFPDDEILLYRLTVNHEQTERYGLPFYCTLISDYYIRLQVASVTELREAETEP